MCFYWCGWRTCMQIKPRAMSRTQNSKAKTATGLHSFTFAATSMDKSKCLEETNFAWTYKSKYAAIFKKNVRHFVLVPSPPMKIISFFQTFILLVYMIVFERILTHTCESLPPPPPPPFGPHNHNFVVYANCPLRFVYFNASKCKRQQS